jgi:hypothetical protein
MSAPTGRVVTVVVATPLPFTVTVPMGVIPLRNVMVPAGVPEPGLAALTVALRVTLAPYGLGEPEVVREVTVNALRTWRTVALAVLLDEKLLSPEYVAVRLAAPSGKLDVLRVATPFVSVTGEPICVVPS